MSTTPIYDRLQALGITLPPVSVPAAAYVPYVQTGKLIFLSGHIARKDGKPWVGQLGKTLGTDEGKLAARAIAIDLMGTLHAALAANGQDLNQVKRIVTSNVAKVGARGCACVGTMRSFPRTFCRAPACGAGALGCCRLLACALQSG